MSNEEIELSQETSDDNNILSDSIGIGLSALMIDKVKNVVKRSIYSYYIKKELDMINESDGMTPAEDEVQNYNTGIRSTCLSNVMYDPRQKQMAVQFVNSGRIYVYDDIPQKTCYNLVTAPSVGRYYNYNIKLIH